MQFSHSDSHVGTGAGRLVSLSAHVDGHVDSQVPIVGKELSNVGVEDETVGIHDGRLCSIVYAARGGLPGQSSSVAVQLQSITEIICFVSLNKHCLSSNKVLVYTCKQSSRPACVSQ